MVNEGIILTEITNERRDRDTKPRWYVVHTYSGHENKVKTTMELMVKNQGMEDLVLEVAVPTEEYVEEKDGVKKTKERKLYPSYVLVRMIMTDESWYLVRNTRGVTGFLGPASNPIPLTKEEEISLGVKEVKPIEYNYNVGDSVNIIDGPFMNFMGEIADINEDKEEITVLISMFGRETKLDLAFNQAEKV